MTKWFSPRGRYCSEVTVQSVGDLAGDYLVRLTKKDFICLPCLSEFADGLNARAETDLYPQEDQFDLGHVVATSEGGMKLAHIETTTNGFF